MLLMGIDFWLLLMNTPEFESFVNHYTACPHCKPRNDVYCIGGRNLWIDDKAAFIADLETLAERQYWIAQTKKMSPQYVEKIKAVVVKKFKARLN
jgi:hypothetical protein